MTVSVRVATPDDGAACAAIYAPWVTDTVISFEIDPPDAAAMAARIDKMLPDYPWLVAERDGAPVGYAYGARHRERAAYRWGVDVGVYLRREACGQGVGTALYRALLALLKAQGFETAYGGITLPNPASVALHERFGFTPAGVYARTGYKMGAWRDVGWWQLRLGGAGDPPAEPVPFDRFRQIPGWDAPLAASVP
jgi:phosphinothricin acetyltransferase